jgi:hypothetical protein
MEETLGIMLEALRMILLEKGLLTPSVQDYFTQLGNFILCKKREINKFELLLEKSFNYDFESIDALNYQVDPRSVKRTMEPIDLKFFHEKQQQNEISNALSLYNDHTDGIHRLLYETNLQKFYRNFQQANTSLGFIGKNKALPNNPLKTMGQQSVRRSWEDLG